MKALPSIQRCRLLLALLAVWLLPVVVSAQLIPPPPSITCPTNLTLWACSSNIVWQYPPPTVVGGCLPLNIVCAPPSGSTFPLGVTTVTCRVIDNCQRVDTCTFTVTVRRDTEPPVITCPTNMLVRACPTAAGGCGAVVVYPPPIASDNSGQVGVTCLPPSGSFMACGVHVVTCRAEDRCGNKDECTFTVTVQQGGQVPGIQCPADRTLFTCSNSVVLSYPPPVVNPAGTSFICVPPPGTILPLGSHAVTCIASNACGTAQCTFKVEVRPVPPPTILCPTNQIIVTMPCNSNCVPVFYPAPVVVNGTLVGCNPPSGTCLPPGEQLITCLATNICGDRDICRFIVLVVRGQGNPPTIQCPANITAVTCSNCVPVNYPAPVVGNGALMKCDPPSGSCFPLGVTTVNCLATNACSSIECVFTVTVRPVPPPRIQCPTNTIIITIPCGEDCAPITYPAPTVSNGALESCNPRPGTCLPEGVHVVVCRATNQCRDAVLCEFTVRVIKGQGQPPVIRCPQDLTVVACSNECAVVFYPAPIVIGGVLVKCDPPSGTCFPIGATIVNCLATNDCGRSECKFTVNVLPDRRPTLSIKRDGRYVIICWPKTCACYKLQSTRSLNPPIVWTDVPGTPDDSGDSWCVRMPIEARHRFFRLIKCDQATAPVFGVTGVGITRAQAGRLADALNIPPAELHDEGGGLLFIDPLKFQAIPMKPIQDPALIEELTRGSETDGRSELSFKGFDFEGLKQLRVLDDAKAVDVWEHAFRQAGIELGSGEPVVRHTTFDAVDPNGRPVVEETMIDTHVVFQFDLGGLSLIGPGANIRMCFPPIGTLPGGTPTALQASFRQLKLEGETPIISVREAARRCAALYPNLQGDIRPQLAYYAPSLLLPAVQKILPCYICAGDASVDGQRVNLLQSIIPASEDPALTPSVALEASAQGSLVNAKATPAGGTPPYTSQWSSSSADLGGIPPGASTIEYLATPRADERSETVRVIVTDANGIQAQASKTVEVTGGSPGLLFTAAVGGVSDYGTERGVSDLCAAQQTAFNARFALDGYTRRFNWAASTAWERDFKQGGTGLDHLYVDNADITFYMGHGSGQGFTFENNHDDTLLRYSDAVGAWGNVDLEWMALLSCSVIADSYGGLNWAQRWGPTFDGLHLLLGFENTAYDSDGFGNAFAQWMLGYKVGFITLPPMPVRSAWFLAHDGNQPSSVVAVTMGVVGPSGLSNYDDYFWGKGPVGPDVRGANIHGYWRVRHP